VPSRPFRALDVERLERRLVLLLLILAQDQLALHGYSALLSSDHFFMRRADQFSSGDRSTTSEQGLKKKS